MSKKLPLAFAMAGLVLLAGSTSHVLAGSCFSQTQCNDLCTQYCTSKNDTCQSATLTGCDSNGNQVCSVLCRHGSGYFPTCSCTMPGGSPIFRKQQPTEPPPQSQKSSKQTAKPAHSSDQAGGKCEGSKQPS